MAAATITESRLVEVTARAGSDLKNAGLIGNSTPFLEITVGDAPTLTTKPDRQNPENPVFDDTFSVDIGPATPGDLPPVLKVVAKNKVVALPDTTIGSGSVQMAQLLGTGAEEARVQLSDNSGAPVGVAFIGLRMVSKQEQETVPSAAGAFLGEVKGLPAEPAAPATTLPSGVVSPATPLVGAVAPGQMENPASPAYGILKE